MTPVRILHLSDLHVADQPYSRQLFPLIPQEWHPWLRVDGHDPTAIDALAQFAKTNASRHGIDVVVISGDLATTGNVPDLEAALDVVDGTPGRRRAKYLDVLTDAGSPIVLIPGNHDRQGKRFAPGNRNFDSVFGQYWTAGQLGNGVQLLWDNGRSGWERVVLLGADLSLTRRDNGGSPLGLPNAGRFGRGKLYATRRQRLENETRRIQTQTPDVSVLWVVHFEPYCQDPFLKLLNEKSLISAAERCRIPLVLCGHSHRSSVRPLGKTLFSVCGTSCQAYAPDGNHLHLIDFSPSRSAAASIHTQILRFDPQFPALGFVPVKR